MYGSMEAEYEVQRTIKRVELTAFLCFVKKGCGPIKVHADNSQKPEMQACGSKFGKNHMNPLKRDILV